MSNPLVKKRIHPNSIAAIGSRPQKQQVYRIVSTEKELYDSLHKYKNGEIIDVNPDNQEGIKRVQIVLSKDYNRIVVEIYNYYTKDTDAERRPLLKEPYTEEAFNLLNNIHNMNVPGAVVNGSQPGAKSYGSQPGAVVNGTQPGAANVGGKQQTKRHHYKNRRTKRRHNKKRQTKRRR